jgi:tRNA-dihydrouridine synthase
MWPDWAWNVQAADLCINEQTPAMSSFWQQLPRPIIGLAPMDGVGDHAFRQIQAAVGRPAVVYTEFTRVEGLCRARQATVLRNFIYDEAQRPIVAQVYGCDPDAFRQTAILLCQLGFDGIDINFGCPSKGVANGGAGAGMIRTPALAQAVVRATQAGVAEWGNGATVRDCSDIHPNVAAEVERRAAHLPRGVCGRRPIPVSIKTRIGYDEEIVATWIPTLLETEPALIALHGRTLDQAYRGQADWSPIARAAELARGTETLILGNGDVANRKDGNERALRYELDGVLIGRAAMGDPFVFHADHAAAPDLRLARIAVDHGRLYHATFHAEPRYHFLPMRKHLNAYARRLDLPTEIRVKLLHSRGPEEAAAILASSLGDHLIPPAPHEYAATGGHGAGHPQQAEAKPLSYAFSTQTGSG